MHKQGGCSFAMKSPTSSDSYNSVSVAECTSYVESDVNVAAPPGDGSCDSEEVSISYLKTKAHVAVGNRDPGVPELSDGSVVPD